MKLNSLRYRFILLIAVAFTAAYMGFGAPQAKKKVAEQPKGAVNHNHVREDVAEGDSIPDLVAPESLSFHEGEFTILQLGYEKPVGRDNPYVEGTPTKKKLYQPVVVYNDLIFRRERIKKTSDTTLHYWKEVPVFKTEDEARSEIAYVAKRFPQAKLKLIPLLIGKDIRAYF